jgi:hypothetical protein
MAEIHYNNVEESNKWEKVESNKIMMKKVTTNKTKLSDYSLTQGGHTHA